MEGEVSPGAGYIKDSTNYDIIPRGFLESKTDTEYNRFPLEKIRLSKKVLLWRGEACFQEHFYIPVGEKRLQRDSRFT